MEGTKIEELEVNKFDKKHQLGFDIKPPSPLERMNSQGLGSPRSPRSPKVVGTRRRISRNIFNQIIQQESLKAQSFK